MHFDDFTAHVKDTVAWIGHNKLGPLDDWAPVLLLSWDPPQPDLIPMPIPPQALASDLKKDVLTHVLIPEAIDRLRPARAALVMTAWSVSHDADSAVGQYSREHGAPPDFVPRPSEHPLRQECVVVVACDADGHSEAETALITRDPPRPPTLGKWQSAEALHGRFIEPLLAAMYNEQ
jgi:hypothetical protein